jgi:hypothetical protein
MPFLARLLSTVVAALGTDATGAAEIDAVGTTNLC